MGDLDKTSGTDPTVTALKAVARREGIDEAMRVATEMIVSAAAVLAREIGAAAALAVLEAAGRALPDKREDRAVH
jgi:hypothetical protein